MNLAWEVTVEDIAIVLMRNNVSFDADKIFDDHFVGDSENCSRVEGAVLDCTDFVDQCDAALDEIEAILIEAEVIPNSC